MRVGIATKNGTQASIMFELLQPLFGDVKVYDEAAMDRGEFSQSNVHVMIIDYSVESIMEIECVLDMIDSDEPKTILSEKQLSPLQHDERLAWRKRIVDQIISLLPDLAGDINTSKTAIHGNDIWVIGSSTGGPDALNTLLGALPRLPISLIVAQHIGSDGGSVALQKLLNSRQSGWIVEIATDGMQLRPGHAYIVQRDTAVSIEGERISTRSFQLPDQPSPSINASLRSIRRSSSGGVGVIILTGLGDDGTAALKEMKHKTLMVLAQETSDCAARSMPDAARQAGVVDESYDAAGIAKRLAKHYRVGVL
ncbi:MULTISPECIES: chemotaxis protein CheB [Pseudomonas]|uniref:chemotaxis protein CheB n=1 Tax=Pseudomonas TaxID=286 RepID=UPI000C333E9C|nr:MULTISPECIES: chemotaxis protein CheB [Pseudomonas]PWC99017.1 chemotaxis protein CheB [Pseudomonas amygdali pv. lachrymans]WNZ87348.1 chemotaxis protein CheB [Pseudomonas sp. P108]